MTSIPVQSYTTLYYTHPRVKGGEEGQRWFITACNLDVWEHDEVAVLDSHPTRKIDAVLPALSDVTDIAIAITPLLCGEGWEMVTIMNPAESVEFDHDAF